MDQGFDLLVYTSRTDAVGPVPRGSSWIRAAESHVRVQIEPCGPVRIRDRRRRIPRLRTRRARLWGRSARHPERGMACALRRVEPRLRRGGTDRPIRRSKVVPLPAIGSMHPRRRRRSPSPSARHSPRLADRAFTFYVRPIPTGTAAFVDGVFDRDKPRPQQGRVLTIAD